MPVGVDEAVTEGGWSDHWKQTLGHVPESIAVLHDWNPVAEQAYRDMRTWLYEDREDGLPLAVKELVMVVIDVIAGQSEGAVNHVRAGMRAGLTPVQVREALTQCFMVRGINTFGTVGHVVWQEVLAHEARHGGERSAT